MVSGGQKLKILIVEDEALVAMLIEDIIAELGHEVAGVSGRLSDALRQAEELTFDFAIIDLNLNGERTYPLASALRGRGIPFIFATGYGAAGLGPEWSDAAVLQKPFQPADLAAAIARLRPA